MNQSTHTQNRKSGGINSFPAESTTGVGCRTCDDFKTWSKKYSDMKNIDNMPPSQVKKPEPGIEKNPQCPLDKSELGNSTWSLLHTISVTYPENPTDEQKNDVTKFFDVLSRLYPCEYCAQDFRADLAKNPVDTSSRDKLSLWLCNLHNRVNLKIGKPTFDCTKVYERWKDGWLDGSCD